ncbi:MAG: site-2 protease family protein [Patescibacteria group bacterium UBA2163]
MSPEIALIAIVIVILSIIFHEVAHGYIANMLGDPTARLQGRLTLNPIPHIDPVGSVLIPGILLLSGTPFLIGWAKPVPYNPYNLRYGKWGETLVSAAGPAVNILIAALFALLIRLDLITSPVFFQVAVLAIFANIALAIINLIPIPPLDGSKILRAVLPSQAALSYARLEQMTYALGPFGLIGILLLLVFVFSDAVFALVRGIFTLLTGVSL